MTQDAPQSGANWRDSRNLLLRQEVQVPIAVACRRALKRLRQAADAGFHCDLIQRAALNLAGRFAQGAAG